MRDDFIKTESFHQPRSCKKERLVPTKPTESRADVTLCNTAAVLLSCMRDFTPPQPGLLELYMTQSVRTGWPRVQHISQRKALNCFHLAASHTSNEPEMWHWTVLEPKWWWAKQCLSPVSSWDEARVRVWGVITVADKSGQVLSICYHRLLYLERSPRTEALLPHKKNAQSK